MYTRVTLDLNGKCSFLIVITLCKRHKWILVVQNKISRLHHFLGNKISGIVINSRKTQPSAFRRMTNKENLVIVISIWEQCCYSNRKSNTWLFFLLEPTFNLYKNMTQSSQCLSRKDRKILYWHCMAFSMKKNGQKQGATTLEIISKLFHFLLCLICSE